VLAAGESVFIEPGSVHRAKNASQSEGAVVRWETRLPCVPRNSSGPCTR
jgi:mannose-6-phosphate isomerase-like protein (cupin superfamily)